MPKKLLFFIFILSHLFTNAKSWVYFDLGNTVINTRSDEGFRFYNGALEYLHSLRQMGYSIGLISNIPESFGQSHDEKLATLKEYIASKWIDQNDMDWNLFEDILLPLNNSQLKPADFLYFKAIENSEFCPMAYISENVKEVIKARDLGIAGHLFLEDDQVDFDKLYIPLSNLRNYILTNSKITPPQGHQECNL